MQSTEENNLFFTISPSPTQSSFLLFTNNTIEKATVFDLSRRVIEALSLQTSETNFGENYLSGIYLVRLQSNDGRQEVIKVVKE
ncbi:MAG: T9SS type A sorting domain-containing protein [Chitinophagales bacterium]|nr:T9SS type A sorting domain-containing protein [Chitinophagales bacterium]